MVQQRYCLIDYNRNRIELLHLTQTDSWWWLHRYQRQRIFYESCFFLPPSETCVKKCWDAVCLMFLGFWIWLSGSLFGMTCMKISNYWSSFYMKAPTKPLFWTYEVLDRLDWEFKIQETWHPLQNQPRWSRRRSPLLPWIWERHLKQHCCRRWVEDEHFCIFLLLFGLMFSSETSMHTQDSSMI